MKKYLYVTFLVDVEVYNGYVIPPFVILIGKTLSPELTKGEVPGTLYGLSANGWIDMELFSAWFFDHFLKYVCSKV